jgi:hypothetical protein
MRQQRISHLMFDLRVAGNRSRVADKSSDCGELSNSWPAPTSTSAACASCQDSSLKPAAIASRFTTPFSESN